MAWLERWQTQDARKNEDIRRHLKKGDQRRDDLLKAMDEPGKHPRSKQKNPSKESDVEGRAGTETTSEIQQVLMKPGSKDPVRHCLFPKKSTWSAVLINCVLPVGKFPLKKSDGQRKPDDETLDLPDIRPL